MKQLSTNKGSFLVLLMGFPATVFAGGLSVEAVGVRPFSMAGAFTAIADSAEATHYNPAGLTQFKGTTFEVGAIFLEAKNSYTHVSGDKNVSKENPIAPSLFAAWDTSSLGTSKPVHFGFGIYAPFARKADYGSNQIGTIIDSNGEAVRKDFSLTAAYDVNERLSVGGGIIAANGITKQTIQPGYGVPVTITDDLDGWGYGGILSLMYKPNKKFNIGAVYRSQIDMEQDGTRKISTAPVTFDVEAEINYPATLGLGVAYFPNNKLSVSFGADWTEWSHLQKVVTETTGQPDQTTLVESDDTWELKVGVEYKPDSMRSFRAGFLHSPSSTPTQWILPQRPDYKHFYALSLGGSMVFDKVEVGMAYEYAWSDEDDVKDNSYGFNGKYEIEIHSVGLSMKYLF